MSEISGGSDSMDMSSETETGGTETGVQAVKGRRTHGFRCRDIFSERRRAGIWR